ncbi:MAG: leucine-rich repeat domain-containing protein [Clostridia bacterium]|nr:leucine-rich repeat domain-containing protein [Clostridia bacterium]
MMKNLKFKHILLLALAFALVLAMSSCDIINSLLPGGDDTCVHEDANGDKICDKCEEKLEGGDPTPGPGVETEAPDLKGVVFNDKTVTYDGTYHDLSIDKATVPEGITVLYSTNRYMNAGTYTVTADFYFKGVKLEGESKTATLTINKATYDVSGVTLVGATKIYDGVAVTGEIQGRLPAGVSATYVYKDKDGNTVDEIVNVGEYTVWATLVGDSVNYNDMEPLSATVEIRRATVTGISMRDAAFLYDGTPKSILAIGVPEDVEVSYVGNRQTDVGTYTVTASFTVSDNYEPIGNMSATMSIYKLTHDMSGIHLLGSVETYDGTSKMPAITGELPSGLGVTYTAVDESGNEVDDIVNVGVYTVTATFSSSISYEPVAPMVATVVVNKAAFSASIKDTQFIYDGKEKSIELIGDIPADVKVSFTGNAKTMPGRYIVTVSFEANDNYVYVSPMSAVMNIVLSDPTASVNPELTYEAVDGGYAVTGITGEPSMVVIPSTYNGEKVVSIKSNAFRAMTSIKYVYIPETVTNIGNAAFYGCTSLTGVHFADFSVSVNANGELVTTGASELKTIGQKAFADTALAVVDLPDSLVAIGFGIFEGCDKLEKLTVPFIGGSVNSSHPFLAYFFGSDAAAAGASFVPASLSTVIISDSCLEIPAYAFMNLSSIKSIHIGASVAKIGINAFSGCTSLRDIYVPSSVISIPASASAKVSPFYGCDDDLLIVVESFESVAAWGEYYRSISDTKSAVVVFNKTYEDYCMNKESYRVADPSDSSALAIGVGGAFIPGFKSDVYDYTVDADINTGFGEISVIPNSTLARYEIGELEDGKVKVKVTSADGLSISTYTIKLNVTGELDADSTVVNKNGADATVSFVIDDGFIGTGRFAKDMLLKYPKLALSFGIYPSKFGTLITEDLDGDGILEYVMDENGNYTYTIDKYVDGDESQGLVVDFWRDILSATPGRSEIIAHSYSHKFWGVNDEGGSMFAIGNSSDTISKTPTTFAKGSTSAEMFGAQQMIKDLFGDLGSRAITFITPGIAVTGSTKATETDVNVTLNGSVVRLVSDTAVAVQNGVLIVAEDAVIDLISNKITIPSGTAITTNAEYTNSVIPAGTVIKVVNYSTTIPKGTQIIGHGTYWAEIYDKAYEEGVTIGCRNTAGGGYHTKDYFTSVNNRQKTLSFSASTTSEANIESDLEKWIGYIDTAVSKQAWVSYCIHAITDTLDEEGSGGHKITKVQGEALFKHAVDYGDKVWIANYTDAALYYHEWSSAKTTSSYNAETGELTVSLTDNERDDIYDMPLTVKAYVPATWAEAECGDLTLKVNTEASGRRYVLVDVAPETSVTITEK